MAGDGAEFAAVFTAFREALRTVPRRQALLPGLGLYDAAMAVGRAGVGAFAPMPVLSPVSGGRRTSATAHPLSEGVPGAGGSRVRPAPWRGDGKESAAPRAGGPERYGLTGWEASEAGRAAPRQPPRLARLDAVSFAPPVTTESGREERQGLRRLAAGPSLMRHRGLGHETVDAAPARGDVPQLGGEALKIAPWRGQAAAMAPVALRGKEGELALATAPVGNDRPFFQAGPAAAQGGGGCWRGGAGFRRGGGCPDRGG